MTSSARTGVVALAVLALVEVAASAEQPPATQSFVYVTSQDDGTLTRIDPGTMQKQTFAVPRGAVAVAPIADSRRLILVYPDAQVLRIVNLADHSIERVLPSAGQPFGLAYDAEARQIFVGDWTGNRLSKIDVASGRVLQQTKTGRAPAHIVFDDRDHRIFVCERESNAIGVFDSSTLTRIAEISVGRAPFAIAYSPVTRRVYVANVQSNDVSAIDAEKLTVLKSVGAGAMPYGLAISQDGKRLAVTSQAKNSVLVLDAVDLTKISEAAVGQYPEGVVFGPLGRLYVADWFADAVSVVDTSKPQPIAKIKVGAGPRYLAVAR